MNARELMERTAIIVKERWLTLYGLWFAAPAVAFGPTAVLSSGGSEAYRRLGNAIPPWAAALFWMALGAAAFLSILIAFWLAAAFLIAACDGASREWRAGAADGASRALSRAAKRFFPGLGTAALLSAVVGGGLVLFVLPGLFFAVWFCLAPYAWAREDARWFQAFFSSRDRLEGRTGTAALALASAAAILAGLSMIPWVGPLLSWLVVPPLVVAGGLAFDELARERPTPRRGTALERAGLVWSVVLGFALVPAMLLALSTASLLPAAFAVKYLLRSGTPFQLTIDNPARSEPMERLSFAVSDEEKKTLRIEVKVPPVVADRLRSPGSALHQAKIWLERLIAFLEGEDIHARFNVDGPAR